MATPQELAKAVHDATAALNKAISDASAGGLRVDIEQNAMNQMGRVAGQPVLLSRVYSIL